MIPFFLRTKFHYCSAHSFTQFLLVFKNLLLSFGMVVAV